MSNESIQGLVDSNLHTLAAARQLLEPLSGELYTQVQRPYFESSLGKHLRHILDHYLCFRRDLATGLIDYDQRLRECMLETDKDYAINIIAETEAFLETLKTAEDKPLQVIMCSDVALPCGITTSSSLGRELQFLQGHSVHHYALIATILKISDVAVEENFGVAPSTIVHEKTVKESA